MSRKIQDADVKGSADVTADSRLINDNKIYVGSNSINKRLDTSITDGDLVLADSITNTKLANMATQTIKGRTTAGTGDPEDLSASQATAILSNFVGDSGSGGTNGLVPAPASGDAAADKFLKANGSWATTPAGTLRLKIKARRSSAQSISSGSATTIIFNTEDTDNQSAYNNTTGEFTVPTGGAGFYIISPTIDLNNTSGTGQRTFTVYINGSQSQALHYDASPAIATLTYQGTVGFQLADADVVTIRLHQNSGGSLDVGGSGNDYNHLTIFRVYD